MAKKWSFITLDQTVHKLTAGFYAALYKDRCLFSYPGQDICLRFTPLSSCTRWKMTFYHVRCHFSVVCRTAILVRKTDNCHFANITNNCSKFQKLCHEPVLTVKTSCFVGSWGVTCLTVHKTATGTI
jgi:hypothetical protein